MFDCGYPGGNKARKPTWQGRIHRVVNIASRRMKIDGKIKLAALLLDFPFKIIAQRHSLGLVKFFPVTVEVNTIGIGTPMP
ncbi:hypothetical protein D3C80_1420810 [compost metagenome]